MNPNFIYSRIQPHGLEFAWVEAMPWIAKALGEVNHDHAELFHIHRGLMNGYLQLWAIQDKAQKVHLMFLVTELHTIGEGPGAFKTLICRWAAGREMERWLDEIEILETIAAREGYHKVEAWGRPGWVKALKPYGYQLEFVVVSKIIQRGMN